VASEPGAPYRALYTLLLGRLPPEGAHRLAALAVSVAARTPGLAGLLRRRLAPHDPALRVRALGLTFPSPLGAAAGVDKDAGWVAGLGLLGFGFVEVGTVTAQAQDGNPKPRVFRLPRDRALLNRMGFPNPGAHAVAARLARHGQDRSGEPIVGVNVGKGMQTPLAAAAEDYRGAVRDIAPLCDYLVLNVSSPNTPGLGDLQAVELLRPLIVGVQRELAAQGSRLPLLVKIAPDLSDAQVDAVADLALELGLAGIVAVNTTTERDRLSDAAAVAHVRGGGVSGPPLRSRAVEVLERLHGRGGDRLVLVSVGGVQTAADAWERIRAGATLVQAYTGFVYGGPGWPARVNRGLARRVRAAGCASIEELVGVDAAARH
jgi:dihydroorotate dehydrogenase